MDTGGGMLSRLSEKILGWIALALIVGAGIALWQIGPAGRTALWSGIWRTLLWFAVAGALPWISRLFIRRLLELGTNWAGVALVGGMTLVNLVLGLILLGGFPSGGWGWLAALAALGLAGTYNFLVCEYLAEREGL